MSKKKSFQEFLTEATKVHSGKGYAYDESTYVNTHTPIKVVCPKHGEFWVTPKAHLLYECRACSYEKRAEKYKLSTDEFILKAKLIHGSTKFDYSLVKYEGAKIPVKIICPKHGEFLQKPNNHLNGSGCPCCKKSKLEIAVGRLLSEQQIDYVEQYKEDWLGRQSLDFYLPCYNIAIECQGKQHFGQGGWIKEYDFQKIKELDERKFLLCVENNIELYYLANKRERSYISKDLIYRDRIFFDVEKLISFIKQKKKNNFELK